MDKITNSRSSMRNTFEPDKNKKTTFEVIPLDINVAQIQFKLQKRADMEIPENGIFAPVVEKYDNRDRNLDISDIKVTCKSLDKSRDEREVVAEIFNRARTLKYSYSLFIGKKKQLLEYLNSKDNEFFETVKQFALYVSDQNQRKA